MDIKLNAFAPIQKIGFNGNNQVSVQQQVQPDSFVRTDKKEVHLKRLNELFPQGGVDGIYKEINKRFNIDQPPKLQLLGDNDGITGGGFTFEKNSIDLSLTDLVGSDTKIVGIKNGKRITLISPQNSLPLFIDKESADKFVEQQKKLGNFGFDELVAEPVTDNEQRKFIVQKISHEVIHAQQHQIMRQTEGIDEKTIIQAWTHVKPKNMIDKKLLEIHTNRLFDKSYWANQPKTETQYKKDSQAGMMAYIWLDAVLNYPRVDSPEYNKNALEVDAYKRSAAFANRIYGPWCK